VSYFIRWITHALALIAAAAVAAAPAQTQHACAAVGEWTVPGGGRIAAQETILFCDACGTTAP